MKCTLLRKQIENDIYNFKKDDNHDKIYFRLTGVTFGDRQANIKTQTWYKLILEHEKDNDYDKFAVIVKTTDGKN